MADILTPIQRHSCMSRIRGKDTKPEIRVRKGLHRRGFRFRLQDRRLPGRPDITLPKYGVAIMVNGCFWHGHKGCRYATKPRTNPEFWETKIERNRHRDEVTTAHLEALGWTVITVWECELRGKAAAEARIEALAEDIRKAGEMKLQQKRTRHISRTAAKKEREEMLQRQARLEEEIKRRFPIPLKIKTLSHDDN
ncbi:MAG: DNA mismatch endonuclease Vsr [Bacteroidales bacterium]|nr:DNA mismatch endonuclease Vsr [Bacteroidales bacterium]